VVQKVGPVTTSYAGNCTTVTDEASKTRESCADGLGRMTEVIENPGALGYVTNYTYDALDDLTGVVENTSHPRSFAYDSLARLTSSTNPESGKISYTYDANGNVQTRTDARTILTTYAYDALNRVTTKVYSDGTPTAEYFYDATLWQNITLTNTIGRLAYEGAFKGASWLTSEGFSYDAMGRAKNNSQCLALGGCPSGPASVLYSYDLAGDITSFSNGLGVTFSYTLDGAGRTTQLLGLNNPPQYPQVLAAVNSSTGFWPNGTVRNVLLGNGLTETSAYNNRLQRCRINVNSSGTALGTCTDAIPSGSVQDFNYGFNFGTADNGDVIGWTATGQQSFSRSYSYDQLNRLSTMSDSATNQACRGLSWVYDPWDNRTAQNVTSGSCLSPQTPVNANNQLTVSGYTYDAAGNLTHDASHSYTYDSENRLATVDGGSTATYTYDADGHRVAKTTSAGNLDYLYDLTGNVTGEWNTGPIAHYAYMNGQLVAEYIASTTYFIHKDHLGSTRLVTGASQSLIDNMDYLPFGELISGGTATSHKFTSKERDPESNLDNFGARYNSSNVGRFMSPDSKHINAHLSDPQSFNRYVYTRNNPLLYIDPDGKDFKGAWAALKQVINEVTVKAGAGFGAGGQATGRGYEAQYEAAVKATLTFNNGKTSLSLTGDAGATGKLPTTPKAGLGISADAVVGSYDMKAGRAGGPEDVTGSFTVGTKTTQFGVIGEDRGSVTVGSSAGAEVGFGEVAGGSVTISPAGLADLKQAGQEIKDMVVTPPAPPPPPPPKVPVTW